MISIIIPTRDRPQFLRAAVESVLHQTHSVEQIIIVDDGSSAENTAHIEALACAHPAIELHRTVGRGASAARNCGLKHARGEYLLFLDDDDLIHPRLCEDGIAVLSHQDADAVVFGYEVLSTSDGISEACPAAATYPAPARSLEAYPTSSFLRYLIPINSCLLRREKIGAVQFPESLSQGEDTYFWIELAARGLRFAADPRVYANVRRHPGNVTRSHARYRCDIQACYERLLANELPRDPRDRYLVHLKLCWFKMVTGRRGWSPHLWRIVVAPGLLAREFMFWLSNYRTRRRMIGYYFSQ